MFYLADIGGNQALDAFYLLIMGVFVFFMQCGFALLEAGTVRSKNTKNILLKNLLDACLGAIIWWAWGMGVAYGDSGTEDGNVFIGTAVGGSGAFLAAGWGTPEKGGFDGSDGYTISLWFFQYVFAAAAATIVSGAVAERAQLVAYLIYTSVITGFIYPVVVHWVWCNNGFLSGGFTADKSKTILGGCLDFAGSGVVHMTGGVAALCGAFVIKPRIGRFDENGNAVPMPGQSTPFQVLGTFILWMGWYGFNPGSTLGITPAGYGPIMARAAMCTTLSAAVGGITVVFFDRIFSKTYDVGMVCNGILAGLVSITAGCACMLPWAAFLTGFIGAFVYYGASKLMLKLKIDDPLDAFAVHGACGFWGVLAVGVFGHPEFVSFGWGDAGDEYAGFLYGGSTLFAAQLVALIIEIAWVASLSTAMFFTLKMSGILRVSEEVEMAGMDVSKHGGSAYNH
jgi:Amt family ammonium transporter